MASQHLSDIANHINDEKNEKTLAGSLEKDENNGNGNGKRGVSPDIEEASWIIDYQLELKKIIRKINGVIKDWIEYQPGLLVGFIEEYGVDATREGIEKAYHEKDNPNMKEIREYIRNQKQ